MVVKFSIYLNRRVFVMPPFFPNDCSKVVPLLQFFFYPCIGAFICAAVLSLFVRHLFFWCPGKFGAQGREGCPS